jgi:hypothetical protein
MVLDILEKYKDKYKAFIKSADYDELYKWESMKNFQDNWDIDANDFRSMYDRSFANEISSNLWASQFFYPKQTMLEFIKIDSERVRSMFKELYDEAVDIEKRIDRFVYNCDELLNEFQKINPNAKHHFHDRYRMISVYLCFRFPMQYSIYKYTEFKEFMEKVRAKTIPGTNEIARFFKVMKTIHGILAKDQELMKIHSALRKESKYFQEDSLLLAQDFYWCSKYYL